MSLNYEDTGALLKKEKQSWATFGAFLTLFGIGLLIPFSWALLSQPARDLPRLLLGVLLGLIVFSIILLGFIYFLIALRTPGIRVTPEGISVAPRPVDVIRGRPHLVRFSDLERLYQGPEQVPEAEKRETTGGTWILTDTGWRRMTPSDILITKRSGRPLLVDGGMLSDRAKFLEAVSRGLEGPVP